MALPEVQYSSRKFLTVVSMLMLGNIKDELNSYVGSILDEIRLNALERSKLDKKTRALKNKLSHNSLKATPRESSVKKNKKASAAGVSKPKTISHNATSKTKQLPAINYDEKMKKRELVQSKASSKYYSRQSGALRNKDYIKVVNEHEFAAADQIQPKVRTQSFKVNPNWEHGKIEGMPVTYYSKRTVNEKRLQHKMLLDKFYVISEKGFKLRVILDRGIKIRAQDVVDKISLAQAASINKNIEQLIGFLHGTMEIVNEYLYNPDIKIIELKSEGAVKDERKVYSENVKALSAVFDSFVEFSDNFKGYTLRESSEALAFEVVQKLVYYLEKCRYLQNIIEEEYKSYDDLINGDIKRLRLHRKEELRSKKRHSNIFDKLFSSSKKTFEPLPQIDKKQPVSNKTAKKEGGEKKEETKRESKKPKESKKEVAKEEGDLLDINTNTDDLNDYIKSCFKKIMPRSSTSYGILQRAYSLANSSRSRSKMSDRKITINQLESSIKMLHLCRMTEDNALRVNANELLKSIEKDYRKMTSKNSKRLHH